MPISFRRVVNKAKADSKAAFLAAPKGPVGRQTPAKPYVKPSELQAFRLLHKISQEQAAALLGYQTTYWNWRENGALLMPPEVFTKAVAKAGPPPGDQLAPKKKRATQEERLDAVEAALKARFAAAAELEARFAALEDRIAVRNGRESDRPGASLI